MHAVVTGGAGFIGSHLLPRLVGAGFRVTVIDDLSTGRAASLPPGADLITASLLELDLAPLVAEADVVIHLAAISSVEACRADPVLSRAVNHDATARLSAAMLRRAPATPLVFASSAAVYGDCTRVPIDEDQPCRPLSVYGQDKWLAEQTLARAAEAGLPVTVLRIFNVYGPGAAAGSPRSGVVSRFDEAVRKGAPLLVYGDGEQSRDFVHVEDVAGALLAAGTRQLAPGTYNLCSGTETTVKALAALASTVLGTTEIRFAPGRVGEPRRSVGDGRRLAAALPGWAPRGIAQGIGSLVPSTRRRALDRQRAATLAGTPGAASTGHR